MKNIKNSWYILVLVVFADGRSSLVLRPLIECWRKEAFILDYDKCYVWNSTCHFSFFCHLISNLFYVIFCKNCLIRLLCNHVSCVLPFHYQMYVFGDKLIIFINTNHLSIAHICTKNILAYYVSECHTQSIPDAIKEKNDTIRKISRSI